MLLSCVDAKVTVPTADKSEKFDVLRKFWIDCRSSAMGLLRGGG
jgi:hypothetical protein